jgi:hypothetical protein
MVRPSASGMEAGGKLIRSNTGYGSGKLADADRFTLPQCDLHISIQQW